MYQQDHLTDANTPAERHDRSGKKVAVVSTLIAVIGLALGLLAWQYPKSPDPVSTPEERRPYLETVDGICRELLPRFSELGPPPTDADVDVAVAWFTERDRLYGVLLTNWARQQAPEGDDELVRAILDPLDEEIRNLDLIVQSLQRGYVDDANAVITKLNDARAAYRNAARAYGLRVCHEL